MSVIPPGFSRKGGKTCFIQVVGQRESQARTHQAGSHQSGCCSWWCWRGSQETSLVQRSRSSGVNEQTPPCTVTASGTSIRAQQVALELGQSLVPKDGRGRRLVWAEVLWYAQWPPSGSTVNLRWCMPMCVQVFYG